MSEYIHAEDVRALISTEFLDCLTCGYNWNECDLAEFEKQVIPDQKIVF